MNNDQFNGDSWMNDPEKRKAYEAGLIKLDEKLKPITDALNESENLTMEDYRMVIH